MSPLLPGRGEVGLNIDRSRCIINRSVRYAISMIGSRHNYYDKSNASEELALSTFCTTSLRGGRESGYISLW